MMGAFNPEMMQALRASAEKKAANAGKPKIKTGIQDKPDAKLIAYDLETTRIQEGTPNLLYITAYGETFKLSMPIGGASEEHRNINLCRILEENFLIKENDKAMFIAWNGNKYDVYFLVAALLTSDKWLLQPYMTASKAIRGCKVTSKFKVKGKKLSFQFLDGISMTGIVGKSLKDFLKTFAPDYQKLTLDFETTEFDPRNESHVKYAERDSEGLYHGMCRVREIIKSLTGNDLKPTVGNLAVRYFMDNIPQDVDLRLPKDEILKLLHGPVKRGGYCWASRQYDGPVWKYDINQAYAAAMRDAALPCGMPVKTDVYVEGSAGIYECVINRTKKTNVPFYYKDNDHVGCFTDGKKVTTWITSIEIEHLKKDGWGVKVKSGWFWSSTFNMQNMVDKLETLRTTDKDGPSGPLGTMVKALGNNAYGKTLEQVWGSEFVLSADQPEGYQPYDIFNKECRHVYSRPRKTFPKKYHVPQIGVFITAHVRCFVRTSAIKEEKSFLYADTDCLVFDKNIGHLELHPTKYGAWKQECNGDRYIIIGKKCYAKVEDGEIREAKAKGLITKTLTYEHYAAWKRGELPVQTQLQRQNFLKFVGGAAMFKNLERTGTNVFNSPSADVIEGWFVPR